MPKVLSLAWLRCRQSLRANLITGIFLWSFGILMILSYHWSPKFSHLLGSLGSLKKEWSYLYSCISTAFFGGFIPYLFLYLRGMLPVGVKIFWLLFFLIYWGIKGMEVDGFYRLQGFLFGYESNFGTILTKVLVDQFVYCIFWSAPFTALFYGWKKAGFKFVTDPPWLSVRFIFEESIFLLFSTWIIWIPSVSIIYAMPENLQIPLFNITLCFFVLVISVLEKRSPSFD
jgi:hypothetical protein